MTELAARPAGQRGQRGQRQTYLVKRLEMAERAPMEGRDRRWESDRHYRCG
jgi:hypothetical protein